MFDSNKYIQFAVLLLLAWLGPQPDATDSCAHYVSPDGTCGGATPCHVTIQAAIDAAHSNDEVCVAQGVYTDVTSFDYDLAGWTRTITQVIFIDKSLTVRGGYTITNWTTARPITYPTVIDPQGRGRGGVLTKPDYEIPITVTLEGFSITNGYAEGSGGGLYTWSVNASISDCWVYSNTGGSIGNGLYLSGGNVILTGNRIEDNAGAPSGYGVALDMGTATLSSNYIQRNDKGLLLWNNWAALTNNVLAANEREGLSIIGGEVSAWHTTLADNGETGAYVMNSGQVAGHLVMTNTIIAGPGTGVRVAGNEFDPSTVRLVATLWDNVTDTQVVGAGGQIGSSRDFYADPAFVGGFDYHLTALSPARNRGSFTSVKEDIDGEMRDPLPDLGADEYFDPDSIQQVYLPLAVRDNTAR
jgi:hypothetical protein